MHETTRGSRSFELHQFMHEIFKCGHLKFTVYGHKQASRHTHNFRKCSHTSVGLAQAHPNYACRNLSFHPWFLYSNAKLKKYHKMYIPYIYDDHSTHTYYSVYIQTRSSICLYSILWQTWLSKQINAANNTTRNYRKLLNCYNNTPHRNGFVFDCDDDYREIRTSKCFKHDSIVRTPMFTSFLIPSFLFSMLCCTVKTEWKAASQWLEKCKLCLFWSLE